LIDGAELARAIHVLCVVHWIGGVAFITLVALPLARANEDAKKGWALFEAIERRFSAQVRISIPLAGLTGLWMTWRLDLWAEFLNPALWWLGLMAAVWIVFALIVFVVEPLANGRLAAMAARDPEAMLRRLSHVHVALLAGSVITVLAAVAGAHGGLFS
jgi:uncharacterized membrane protein